MRKESQLKRIEPLNLEEKNWMNRITYSIMLAGLAYFIHGVWISFN